jgi:hypothetical protein
MRQHDSHQSCRATGDRDASNRSARLGRLALPAPQKPEQRFLARLKLLQRMALDPGNDPGDKPARLAHLDDRDERAILLYRNKGSAQVI